MKYAIIFAATAAAHQAYGGYGYEAQSSAPVKPSTTSAPAGYTTVTPGYGKQPVTVTAQNQAYPTCVSAAYGGKSCDKWEEDTYVSTVIKDYDNNYATVTNTDDKVVVYHTKTTITHSATGTGGYAAPTGVSSKNGTDNCWYELYEKIEEVPYKELGPNALPGYSGSGLYPQGSKEQPVHVKEYKGGKWSEYEHTYTYGTPKPEVKVYEKPGVYVVPSKDMVVKYPVDHPAEATATAKAGETCTYGGQYVEATSTGYITAPYGAYKTKTEGGKTVTETVVSYTTIYASTTGSYEVAKPTTTVYDHDVEVTYPTAQHYEAGVYHQPAQTVTITSAGQAYTCEYEKPAAHAATPSPMAPGYNKPSPSPMNPNGGNKYPSYPSQPAKNSTVPAYGSYPASSPAAAYGHAHGYGPSTMVTVPVNYATSSVPVEYSVASPSSTPCESSSTPAAYETQPASSSPAAYNNYPAASSPAAYNAYPAASSPAAYQPAPAASSPAAYNAYPAASSPAAYQPAPAASSPAAYNNYPAASTPAAYESAPSPAAYQPAPAASSPAAYQPAPAVSSPAPAAYESAPTPAADAYAYQPAHESDGPEGNTYSDEGTSYTPAENESYGAEQESSPEY